ncbi:MAG: hypothetical protein ACU84Q_13380 [Gammaproteobacteria bacterium]
MATLQIGDAPTRLCAFVTPRLENQKLAKFYRGTTLSEDARGEFGLFKAARVAAIVACLMWKLDHDDYNPAVATVGQTLENYRLPQLKPSWNDWKYRSEQATFETK